MVALGLLVLSVGLRTAPGVLAGITSHLPIAIEGDGGFTAANGVRGGDGTPGNPFVIEGWDIHASGAPGISIQSTRATFVIRGVTIHDGGTTNPGIALNGAFNGSIEGSTIEGNSIGISLTEAHNATVVGNTIEANGRGGVWVQGEGPVTVTDNMILLNGWHGVGVNGRWVKIVSNDITSNPGHGIELINGIGVSVERNRIEGNGLGLEADSSWDGVISSNTVMGNGQGILLSGSYNITLTGNTLRDDGVLLQGESLPAFDMYDIRSDNLIDGKPILYYKDRADLALDGIAPGEIILANCNRFRLSNISVRDSDVGIEVAYALGGLVADGHLVNNTYGLLVIQSRGLSVEGGDFSLNRFGVELQATSTVIVRGGVISRNDVGLEFFSSTGARVYHNAIMDNGLQVYDDRGAANSWDDGYPSGGNYWSDYDGPDACGASGTSCNGPDQIGDIPYSFSSGGEDRYPLMRPFGSADTPPRASFTFSPNPAMYGETVVFDGTNSSDSDGTIVEYRWRFGDGTVGEGPRVNHVYLQALMEPYNYSVSLTVVDDVGVAKTGRRTVGLSIELSLVDHPSGFRVPLPKGWQILRDDRIGNTTVDLVAVAPKGGPFFRSNILVRTVAAPGVQEDSKDLQGLARLTAERIMANVTGAEVVRQPTLRTIAGHGGLVMALDYPREQLHQEVALVASAAHHRYWILVFTMDLGLDLWLSPTWERILKGFQITLPPLTSLQGLWSVVRPLVLPVAIVYAASVTATVAYVLYRRRLARRAKVDAGP